MMMMMSRIREKQLGRDAEDDVIAKGQAVGPQSLLTRGVVVHKRMCSILCYLACPPKLLQHKQPVSSRSSFRGIKHMVHSARH